MDPGKCWAWKDAKYALLAFICVMCCIWCRNNLKHLCNITRKHQGEFLRFSWVESDPLCILWKRWRLRKWSHLTPHLSKDIYLINQFLHKFSKRARILVRNRPVVYTQVLICTSEQVAPSGWPWKASRGFQTWIFVTFKGAHTYHMPWTRVLMGTHAYLDTHKHTYMNAHNMHTWTLLLHTRIHMYAHMGRHAHYKDMHPCM
jgi:hypothetical protein